MKSTDLTKQRAELLVWVQGGFHEYGDLCARRGQELVKLTKVTVRKFEGPNYSPEAIAKMEYRGNIHDNIRIQIEGYAKEFGRVLREEVELSEEDDPLMLRNDLYGLKKSECPPVVLVELILACTSDYGVTIPDLLLRALPLNDYLGRIRDPNYPRYPRRPRRFKGAVPPSIQFMLETEPYYAGLYGTTRARKSQAARVAFHLGYFYTFVKHFRRGHETLTCLLRTMQYVRRRVPAVADYLRTRGRDTFRADALQRRVLRFFEAHPASESAMRKDILEYLSGAGGHSRKTLLGIY